MTKAKGLLWFALAVAAPSAGAYAAEKTCDFSASTARSLAGVWHVEGDGFAGEAKLPGTLAAAHLGICRQGDVDAHRRAVGGRLPPSA